jgi:ABC-type multidrug transport system permease subunit
MSLLFAAVVLKITVHLTLYVVLAILFGGYSLIGIGAIVGFYSKTGRVAGLATQYLGPVITFLAPVFVPKEALPRFLQVTSTILPTT